MNEQPLKLTICQLETLRSLYEDRGAYGGISPDIGPLSYAAKQGARTRAVGRLRKLGLARGLYITEAGRTVFEAQRHRLIPRIDC